MSEKIYAWLLRLYPSGFREIYGAEALQLFRDRARDETGLVPRLRFWLDLLFDLAVSIPRAHRFAPATPTRQCCGGPPSFRVLEEKPLRRGALFFGGILSVAALGGFPVLMNQAGNYRPLTAPFIYIPAANSPASFVLRIPAIQLAADAGQRLTVSGLFRSPVGQPGPSGAAEDMKLNAAERQSVIRAVIANLKEHYVDPAVAQKMEEALLAHEKAGDYEAVAAGPAFAALLTRQLRDVSHDMHLEVVYSQRPMPERPAGPTPGGLAHYRKAMEASHCTFETVEILPRNVGYLKLDSFPNPSICGATAKAAMASLNHADAIIFDLRDNHGGYPSMVMLIAAYLFNHPEYMYNPRENTTERLWTQSPVPGNRLADKPVYVLISARTFSGAEHFSYDLKMLKRATLVGETTGGATDVGVFHRIDDHFGIGIRETRAINPYSEPDWAVTGVEPNVKVKAADAPKTAEKLVGN